MLTSTKASTSTVSAKGEVKHIVDKLQWKKKKGLDKSSSLRKEHKCGNEPSMAWLQLSTVEGTVRVAGTNMDNQIIDP